MFTRFRDKIGREEGFTLIELLVVIIIIGILAAIAIPVFLNQREKAWKSAVQSDVRNSVVAMEGWFSDESTYVATAGAQQTSFAENVKVSTDDTLTLYGSASAYCIQGTGNGQNAYVTSSSGGVVDGTAGAAEGCAAGAGITSFQIDSGGVVVVVP